MPLYALHNTAMRELPVTSFEECKVKERADIQRLLRDQIEIVVKDGMVLSEEFGDWEDAHRRIDLLVLDEEANLVVVELKRTDNGGHMDLQAIRYAAMVSTLTFEQAVQAHAQYLKKRKIDRDAKEAILKFLGWESEAAGRFNATVRIVLAAADFSREITTTALWLNERHFDIQCIRLKPYVLDGQVVVDVQPLIPLPEAADYFVRIRDKAADDLSRDSRDWNLESFLAELNKNSGADIAALAKTIYDWCEVELGNVQFGRGSLLGRFGPVLFPDGSQAPTFVVRSDGRFTVRFMHIKARNGLRNETILKGFLTRLNQIPGLGFTEDDLKGKPRRRLDPLLDPLNLKVFKESIFWLRDQLERA